MIDIGDGGSSNDKSNPFTEIELSGSRTANIERIVCRSVFNVPIYDKKKMIGRALLVEAADGGQLMLMDICIFNEKDRRKGAANDVMELLTGVFSSIVTGSLSKAGRNMCLKAGFKPITAPDGQTELLLYEREVNDATEKGKE